MPRHTQREYDSGQKGQFAIEIAGIQSTAFKTCDGLEAEFGVIEERDGKDANSFRRQRGLRKDSPIVLTRGVTTSESELNQWFIDGDRRDIDIVQLKADGEEMKRWTVYNAFPTKYKPFGNFDSSAEEVQVEELTLAHEGFDPIT